MATPQIGTFSRQATSSMTPPSHYRPGRSCVGSVIVRWGSHGEMARTVTLTVNRLDPRTRKPKTLASFTIDRSGKVKEKYEDFRFRNDIRRGVRVGGKVFKPEDGPEFMAALDKAYRSSSLLDVVRS